MPAIKEAETVKVTVARGKSVMHQVKEGSVLVTKTSGPGETIELSIEEAAYMREHSFLHDDTAAEVIVRTPMRVQENSGRIGLQTTYEPTSIEANRPGFTG
jgi:type 1 glutamine amidotransferase